MEVLQQQQQQPSGHDHGKKLGASSSAGLNLSNPQQQHPKYAVMIRDAIVSTKQRKGASTLSIAKAIQSKHKGQLPSNFRKMLTLQLRKLVRYGRLIKDQSKFRCTPSFKKNPQAKPVLIKQETESPAPPSRRRRPRAKETEKRRRSHSRNETSRKKQRRTHSRGRKSPFKRTIKKKAGKRKTRRSTTKRSRSSSRSTSKSARRTIAKHTKAKKKAVGKKQKTRNARKRGRYYYY